MSGGGWHTDLEGREWPLLFCVCHVPEEGFDRTQCLLCRSVLEKQRPQLHWKHCRMCDCDIKWD